MPTSRTTSHALRRLAELQSLRTRHQERQLATAIAAHRNARDALEASDREWQAALEHAARALASDELDPERISRLNAVVRLCDRARAEAREKLAHCMAREVTARRAWHVADRQRENLLDREARLARKEARAREDRRSALLMESVAAGTLARRS